MASASNGGWFRNRKPADRSSPMRVLTASARRLDLGDRDDARRQRAFRQGWQGDAWSYRDAVGELRYAVNFLAWCTGRMRLLPAAYEVGAGVESDSPVPLKDIKGVPPEVVALAQQSLIELGNGANAIAAHLRKASTNLSVAGEFFLHGREDTETGEQTWHVRSIDEIVVRDDMYMLREIPSDPQGVVPWIALEPDTNVISRVWNPHPRFSALADSPFRAMLDDAESLLILRRMIRATGRSRLAGAGFLLIPDELSIKRPNDDNDDPMADDFFESLATAMMEPIADEGVASAVVPIVIRGPADYLKEVRWIDPGRQFDAQAAKDREELVGVIATTFDLPKEIIIGMVDLNHWTAWQVDDNTFRHHVEPHVIECCDGLTAGFLRNYLEVMGCPPEWSRRILYWYDPTELVTHPDQTEDALQLHDRLVISDASLLKTAGFDPADAPSKAEIQVRLLEKMRTWPPNLVMAFLHAWDPSLIAPPITVAGTIPGIKPTGVDVGEPPALPGAPAPIPGQPALPAAPEPKPAAPSQSPIPEPAQSKPAPPAVTAAGGEPNTGAMVALYLPPNLASKWALPGGEPPEELHITLAFLGQATDLVDPAALQAAVEQWAKQTAPISGEISGVGLFTAGEDPVTYLSPDLPSLPDARQQLVDALASADVDHSQEHGFTPHITLDYADRVGDVDASVGGSEITFDSVAVVVAEERTDYPLGEALVASAAKTRRLSERLASIDRELRTRLQVAANAAMLRQLERIGNRLRSKVAKDETLRTKIAHTRNERVSAVLGKDVVTAAGVKLDVLGDWSGLKDTFDQWVAAAQKQALGVAAKLGGLAGDHPSLHAAQASMDTAREAAWDKLHGALSASAEALLYDPDPNTAAGEWGEQNPDTLVPAGTVRAALAIAGGATAGQVTSGHDGSLSVSGPVGQIGTGDIVSGVLSDAGGSVAQFRWEHGPSLHPFEPHEALDGVEFAEWDDDALANSTGFPDNSFYMPGDHGGCSCDFTALWDFPGNPSQAEGDNE